MTAPNANVTYNWVTTSSNTNGSQSDQYSIVASWTLADTAVSRGRIQLIGCDVHPYPYGDEYYAHPEEIIAFSLTAKSAGSEIYTFDKNNTGINFNLTYPWEEAYHADLRITPQGPVADIHLTSADGAAQFELNSSTEIDLSVGGSSYSLIGYWQQAQATDAPPMAPSNPVIAGDGG